MKSIKQNKAVFAHHVKFPNEVYDFLPYLGKKISLFFQKGGNFTSNHLYFLSFLIRHLLNNSQIYQE